MSTATSTIHTPSDVQGPPTRLSLRTLFKLDAVTGLASGVLLLLIADVAAPWLGLPVIFLRVVGGLLLPLAAMIWVSSLIGTAPRPPAFWSVCVMGGNAAWIVASVLTVTVWFTPTGWGQAVVLLQAAVVVVLLGLEFRAWRQGS